MQPIRQEYSELLDEAGRRNSNIARTYWHQDAAVVLESAEEAPILTVWVAMTDVDARRGCMEAIRGSHRFPELAMHCPGKTGVGALFTPETLAAGHERIPLEEKSDGVVLIYQKTWHGAGPNSSETMRWSFDLRYRPSGLSTGRDFPTGFWCVQPPHEKKHCVTPLSGKRAGIRPEKKFHLGVRKRCSIPAGRHTNIINYELSRLDCSQ